MDALRGLLTEIGYADALIARELPDGQLQLIDGHLRAATTPDAEVPVLVLDVTEEEADKILLTLDPLAAMAESDSARIQALLETVRTDNEAVEDLLRRVAGERLWRIVHPDEVREADVSPERADELKNKWRTEVGQLWRIEQHRVICGDSTDPIAVKRLWSDDGPACTNDMDRRPLWRQLWRKDRLQQSAWIWTRQTPDRKSYYSDRLLAGCGKTMSFPLCSI